VERGPSESECELSVSEVTSILPKDIAQAYAEYADADEAVKAVSKKQLGAINEPFCEIVRIAWLSIDEFHKSFLKYA
jgi:hypothetical protein